MSTAPARTPVAESTDTALREDERTAIAEHARTCFPGLLGEGGSGFDDLAVLDGESAGRWYQRTVDGARYFHSSGTSGQPKRIPWTPAEDDWYVGEKHQLFSDWLGGCRRGFISLAVGHNAGSAHLVFEQLGLAVHDAGLTTLADQREAVLSFGPDVLYCSPTTLDRLVTALGDAELLRPVRRIITNGEVLFPALRRRAQHRFGLADDAVIDTYGSTEIGTLAASCPACGRYHFLDGLYPEAVPVEDLPAGVRAPRAGCAVLAISSLKRTAFPIIRFLTYDVIEGLRRTSCGTPRFTFDRVVGRCDDIVNYGELFSTYELADLIRGWLPGAGWFVFSECNDLTVVVEGVEPTGFRDELAQRYPLHSQMVDLGLLPAPDLHFVEQFDVFTTRANLPRALGGKDVRRVVPSGLDERWLADLAPSP